MKGLKKKSSINYSDLSARQSVMLYTLAFGVLSLWMFIFFIVLDKSFIWGNDGLPQHYPALRYIGIWGREIITNILKGDFSVRNFDFGIGYGADIFTTFHYYGLTDPLNWLSLFVPENYTHYLYSFLVLIRLYLSGIGFIFYCRTMKQTGIAVVISTFIYVFSAYGLYAGLRHHFFLVPMVYLPFILIGCERIFERKSPALFIASVALCVVSNFYFSYMAIIITAIYVLVRCFVGMRDKFTKTLLKIGKFFVFGILALMVSAFILLPVVIVFMGNNRSVIDKSIPLLYDLKYYKTVVASFMGFGIAPYWNQFGYTPLGLVAVFFLFMKKGRYKQLKVATLILLVLQLFPIFGSVLNGFDYVSNRFIWAFAFLIAFISVCVFRELVSSPKADKLKLLVISLIYLVLFILCGDGRNFSAKINVVLLFAMLVILVMSEKIFRKNARKAGAAIVAAVTVISLGYNGFFVYSPRYGRYVDEFVPNSVSVAAMEVSESSLFNERLKNTENSFKRYEVSESKLSRLNQSLFNETAGVSYYFSLSDTYVVPSFYDVELPFFSSAMYFSSNQQIYFNTLASVKYLVSEKEHGIPYGYSLVDKKECYFPYDEVNTELSLYENKNALPIGYTYDGYITRDRFDKLSPVEKQEAMMQGVLLEKPLGGFDVSAVELTSELLPYTSELSDNAVAMADGILVESKDKDKDKKEKKKEKEDKKEEAEKEEFAVMKICFKGKADSETYIRFKNFNVTPVEKFSDKKAFGIDKEQPRGSFRVTVNSKTASRSVYMRTSYDQCYSGLHNAAVNLGYSREPLTWCTVLLPAGGFYSWDDIEIISQPIDNYEKYVSSLKEDTLNNLKIKNDSISGTADIEKSKILCLSVPYSKGWTAFVDGEEVELLRANGWCMAVPLEKGEHNITLKYATPGLKLGIAISVLGIMLSAAVAVYYAHNGKKSKMKGNN